MPSCISSPAVACPVLRCLVFSYSFPSSLYTWDLNRNIDPHSVLCGGVFFSVFLLVALSWCLYTGMDIHPMCSVRTDVKKGKEAVWFSLEVGESRPMFHFRDFSGPVGYIRILGRKLIYLFMTAPVLLLHVSFLVAAGFSWWTLLLRSRDSRRAG